MPFVSRSRSVGRIGFLALFVLALLMGSPLFAKELASRLGVGFRNSFPIDLPSLASIYYPSAEIGLVGAIGIDTQDQASKFGLQVGVRKIIFKESQLNFFMGGNLATISQQVPGGVTNSGFVLDGIVGSEFFLAGLDNLGLNFEAGIGVANIGTVRFRTIGDSLLRAGMIFYF